MSPRSSDATGGEVEVSQGHVRTAIEDVVHRSLPDWAVFAALMAMLLSMRVAFERESGWLVRTWWLIAAAALYGGLALWMSRRPIAARYAHGGATSLTLGWIGVGAAYLAGHPSFADGALLLLSLPAFGFLLMELWAFGVVVAFAVVAWASLLSRGVEGAEWTRLQMLLFGAVLVAGFVQVSRNRSLRQSIHVRVRDRVQRERLEEMFDSVHRHREELAELSIRDPLTGAFNRRHLAGIRDELERPTAQWGCLMVDLDEFKDVNDRYGHEEGDRVLQAFAHFLGRSGRAEDQLVRYGGDEFVVFVDVKTEDELSLIAERLRAAGELESPAAFSLGWALRHSREPLESVIQRADADMYAAKGKIEALRSDRRFADRRDQGS